MDDSDDRSVHAVRKIVIGKLEKGREVATQLQDLIHKPDRDRGAVDVEDLALQIFRSFADSISVITSSADSTWSAPISAASGERIKKPMVKNRRGCYKRRRTADTWTIISKVEEDGYAWRKYGQKDILNSKFPRCYYRCTHKQQGCKAVKQVQKIQDEPVLYRIIYLGHHTCTHSPNLKVGFDPHDQHHLPKLISFQSSDAPRDDPTVIPTIDHTHTLKEEDTQSDTVDHQDTSSSDAKSSLLHDAWREIFGYCHIWEEGTSCASTSFDGLGMEINGQFTDLDAFEVDQIYQW